MRRLVVLAVLPALLALGGCGDDDGGGSTEAFCDRATEFQERFEDLEAEFEGDEIPSADVFDEAATAIDDLAGDAPEEIADDLSTIADGVREIASALSEVDLSDPDLLGDPEAAAALGELGARMEEISNEVEAASNRVASYLEEECGIQVDG